MALTILCPTRGGQSSYPNQDCAISLAKERDANLIFLYVSDVQFLDHTAAPKVVDIETELDELGEFLVAMAIERAGRAEVSASGVVERGNFRQVLSSIIQEQDIKTIVLGKSRVESSHLEPGFIEDLAEQICKETGVEFLIVHDGEIETKIDITQF